MDILKKICWKEFGKEVEKDDEINFKMKNEQKARKLVMKLQKIRSFPVEVTKLPVEVAMKYSKEIKDDKLEAWSSLEELKSDLESFRARLKEGELKKNIKKIIDDVVALMKILCEEEFRVDRLANVCQIKIIKVMFFYFWSFTERKRVI